MSTQRASQSVSQLFLPSRSKLTTQPAVATYSPHTGASGRGPVCPTGYPKLAYRSCSAKHTFFQPSHSRPLHAAIHPWASNSAAFSLGQQPLHQPDIGCTSINELCRTTTTQAASSPTGRLASDSTVMSTETIHHCSASDVDATSEHLCRACQPMVATMRRNGLGPETHSTCTRSEIWTIQELTIRQRQRHRSFRGHFAIP